MTVDERRRYALFEAARRQLGEDEATALMEMLPPVGWADVATKHDLAAFGHRFEAIDQRFEAIDQRFEAVNYRLDGIDHRLEGMDRRFEAMEHRFEGMEHRFESLESTVLAGLHEQSNRMLMWLVPIVIASIAMSATIAAAV